MSSLINSAADGILGSVLTGIGYLIIRRTRPGRDELAEAWRQQVTDLRDGLSLEREAGDRQQAQRVADLLGQLKYAQTQLAGCQTENKRLQRLLGRAQRGIVDD